MRITVFKNNYKDTDKHPDYIIYKAEEGKDLKKIGALWIGKSAKGTDYMSGELEDFNQAESDYKDAEETQNDDIPF